MSRSSEFSIAPNRQSGGYRLETSQFLPRPRAQVFDFFSDAFNLELLTSWLRFRVITPKPIAIAAGTVIDYRIRLRGIPLRWRSEITEWKPPDRFVDEQVRGPYRKWRHEHIFEEADGGALCRDVVEYSVFGGRLIHSLLVGPDLRRIFAYRQEKLRAIFG